VKNTFEALVTALLVVVALTPLARALAFRVGAVAHPGGRHVHHQAIARLGGIAIAAGVMAGIGALYFLDPAAAATFHNIKLRLLGLLAGGAAMCLVGVVDDTRGLRAVHKLLLQLAVAIFAYACGLRMEGVHVPLLGDIDAAAMALPLTVLWIVGVMNAINLIDGLDGLAAGVVFFAATTNLVVAWLNDAWLVAGLSGAVAGAVLGFLFYNFNPARIFMGDSGSYFLGYLLACTALIGTQKKSTAVSLLVPVMALGVPIFDTLFAMVRRILERRSVFSPDRGHIHHRLLDMGLTHRRAVMLIYAVCGVFTVAAIGISLETMWKVGAALLGASVAMIGLVRFVGYFEYLHLRLRQRARFRSRDAELLRHTVPELPRRFGAARTEAELFQELWRFATEADLGFVEVLELGATEADERCVRSWPEGFKAESASVRDLVVASCLITLAPAAAQPGAAERPPAAGEGPARAALRFGWHSDFGDVSPQSEILLQVATDVLAENLARLGSALAPAVDEPPAERAPQPLGAL
jgi:UDP-GlcNAc:undecaprenyl-phosphate GlcNAc-1-phosphate transferase